MSDFDEKRETAIQKDLKPWERQVSESDEMFARFSTYLLTRNMKQVVTVHFGDNTEGHRRVIVLQAQEYRWKERALAFDRWVAANRESAVADMLQLEVVEIAKQRRTLLNDLYHRVQTVGKNIKAESPAREVKAFASLIKLWDELVRQVEASAGGEMMVGKSADPTTPNVAREMLKNKLAEMQLKSKTPPPSAQIPQ